MKMNDVDVDVDVDDNDNDNVVADDKDALTYSYFTRYG